eukprot:c12701_g1_i1.p1 GENE.c12701_g1_i1~~c12701_g1_i1.p1  ORF type:complete len:504 (+),score=153.20 c12701_g1_i1:63-1574(+)
MATLKEWEQTQIKTFTKWANLHLNKRNLEITNLQTDFEDGINLINLLEIISDKSLGKYNKAPKMKIHQITNLNIAHDFLKAFFREVNVKVVPSPEQINGGDMRSILGMMWVLILRFAISDIDEGGLAAKEGLLLWCKRNTAGYEGVDPPGIENFHTSWRSGLGFCALIHKFRPDLIDYSSLNKDDPIGCMRTAFQIATDSFGIPALLDPEDIANVPKPDEKSIMTYLAEYWKVFSSDTKIFLASQQLARAIERRLVNMSLRDEYLTLARDFIHKIGTQTGILEAKKFETSFDAIRSQYFSFQEYKVTTKAYLFSQKVRIDAAFNALQTKLKNEKFAPYVPVGGLSPDDLNDSWEYLESLEGPYERQLDLALMNVFKDTFKYFDRDNTDSLTKAELQACFSALSLEVSDFEAAQLFGESESISFERFATCLMDKLIESSNSQQIRDICKILQKGKSYLNADDLRKNIGEKAFEWVVSTESVINREDGAIEVDIEKLSSNLFASL